MLTTTDITDSIKFDFGNNASEVTYLLQQAIKKSDHLNDARILRCILFLATGDIEKLKQNLAAATVDPRDVIYWAEYTRQNATNQRLRDFSNPFPESDLF